MSRRCSIFKKKRTEETGAVEDRKEGDTMLSTLVVEQIVCNCNTLNLKVAEIILTVIIGNVKKLRSRSMGVWIVSDSAKILSR